jgi:aspartyl aminopeptidase
MTIAPEIHQQAQDLLEFIDASPSPWHAIATIERRLQSHGFLRLEELHRWSLKTSGRYYVVRGDSSVIAFTVGTQPPDETGYHIIGAHTDSPGLRLKPRAPHAAENMTRLGVEVYGSPILATFTDRDLSLAGRLNVRSETGIQTSLVRFEKALVRLPNLAMHMNRNVNEDGLKLNKQTELPLLLGNLQEDIPPQEQFVRLLAEKAAVCATDIVSWELNVYDTQKGAFWGPDEEFISNSQLDNLASCHAGLAALLTAQESGRTCLCGFFDHEEVGSESAKGADGSFLADVTERIARSLGTDWQGYQQALARSVLISVDMAHAYQPNFASAYEPNHQIRMNAGPVIKTNVNQRYATDSLSEAWFMTLCEVAGVPFQQYVHRTDLACGSTIGPMVSAKLGIRCVDVGSPIWAMHSIRESAGVLDVAYMIRVLQAFFESP